MCVDSSQTKQTDPLISLPWEDAYFKIGGSDVGCVVPLPKPNLPPAKSLPNTPHWKKHGEKVETNDRNMCPPKMREEKLILATV